MTKQHRLSPGPLLGPDGRLIEAGYATSPVKTYDRSRIAAHPLRVKEWDYYLIASDCYALALTIADNGYMGLDSVSLLDFDGPWEITKSKMCLFPMGKRGLPPSSSGTGSKICAQGRDYAITFENAGGQRRLYGHMERFRGNDSLLFDVTLTGEPRDSMVIATPFPGHPKAFYYNQKINCLRAEGRAVLGEREYLFAPAHSLAVLDWGRGVWPYKNTWYWGSASGWAGGALFGFNIGCGFGDSSAATENMLFYNGRAHKLSQVTFEIPRRDGREDYLAPWRFSSDDGRFAMDFVPIIDRAACMDLKLLCSDQHQVFGRFSGTVLLDDGTPVQVRNLLGFFEKAFNKW